MTAVVAVARDGLVVMGIDSCTTFDDLTVPSLTKRIVRHRAAGEGRSGVDVAIAAAGNARLAPDLRYGWTPPPITADDDPDSYAWQIAYTLSEFFQQPGRWDMVRGESGRHIEGEFLLGTLGALWTISADFGAVRSMRGFAAIGSGAHVCTGALDTALRLGATPREAVAIALDVATGHLDNVRGPHEIVELGAQNAAVVSALP